MSPAPFLEDHIDRIAEDIIDVANRFNWDDDDLIRQIADTVRHQRERTSR